MSDFSESPERPPVKVTYSSRQKKKKKPDSDPSYKPEEDIDMPEEKPSSKVSRKEKEATVVAPASPGKVPKKVDVHLPGPAPRTTDKKNSSPSDKKPKSLHRRSVSSISAIQRITDDALATNSPSPNKPISAIKQRKRFATPETADDNASVADSSVMGTGSIRRTEAERIEYFKNQPECAPNIEPHAVMCTRCNKQVNLGRKQTYAVRPWENHRKRCDQKVAAGGSVLDDSASIRSDARSEAGPTVRLTVDERKAILENDPRAEAVQPDQALCRKCQKWIRLSTKASYVLYNWNTHQNSCADAVMSSRVAMAQRKIRLVNDPQAKTFTPRNVECRNCGESVTLTGEFDYTLTEWEAHKQTCTSATASGKSSKPTKPPRSSASTEATVVAEPEVASTSRGTKRRLEDSEAILPADDPDAPRAPVKARTETYAPVQKEAPSILGWFLLPFKGFLQGFREGLSDAPPP